MHTPDSFGGSFAVERVQIMQWWDWKCAGAKPKWIEARPGSSQKLPGRRIRSSIMLKNDIGGILFDLCCCQKHNDVIIVVASKAYSQFAGYADGTSVPAFSTKNAGGNKARALLFLHYDSLATRIIISMLAKVLPVQNNEATLHIETSIESGYFMKFHAAVSIRSR